MERGLLIKVLLTWLIFVPIAIINGGVRIRIYQPRLGVLKAHYIAVVIAIFLFFALSYVQLKDRVSVLSLSDLLLIGITWVACTVLFEFVAGHYLFKSSWEKLFYDYNILKGRVWVLFLLTELFSPFLIKFLMAKIT